MLLIYSFLALIKGADESVRFVFLNLRKYGVIIYDVFGPPDKLVGCFFNDLLCLLCSYFQSCADNKL